VGAPDHGPQVTTARGSELPGLSLAGSPRFDRASGVTMRATGGDDHLDLAMLFGSRIWGHEPVSRVLDEGARAAGGGAQVATAAPGLGDLYASELREAASQALVRHAALLALTPDELAHHAHIDAEWRHGFALGDAEQVAAERLAAVVLHTGSEAVETSIKTALRATGRTRIVAFEGGYHGTFGLALAATHRPEFREPWAAQYGDTVRWRPWGEGLVLDERVACVVVEPWQGRAGIVPPPEGWLGELRAACDAAGALLVLDGVLCGGGRLAEAWPALLLEASPDLLCLGKAIGCGVAASAVVGRREVLDAAWSLGDAEPLHTSTMLGEPVAALGVLCATARLADAARQGELAAAASGWHRDLAELADDTGLELRGAGLAWALDTGGRGEGFALAQRLLKEHRIVVVPSGLHGGSVTLLPAAPTPQADRERFIDAVRRVRFAR